MKQKNLLFYVCNRYYCATSLQKTAHQDPQSSHFLYLRLHTELVGVISVMKGKAVPLQAWSGPEGSRKLRLTDFMTTAQDGGKAVSLRHRPPLPPGNAPVTYFC